MTPRTDERALVWTVAQPREGREMVSADFARTLERENAKLRDAGKNLRDFLTAKVGPIDDIPDEIFRPFLESLKR